MPTLLRPSASLRFAAERPAVLPLPKVLARNLVLLAFLLATVTAEAQEGGSVAVGVSFSAYWKGGLLLRYYPADRVGLGVHLAALPHFGGNIGGEIIAHPFGDTQAFVTVGVSRFSYVLRPTTGDVFGTAINAGVGYALPLAEGRVFASAGPTIVLGQKVRLYAAPDTSGVGGAVQPERGATRITGFGEMGLFGFIGSSEPE